MKKTIFILLACCVMLVVFNPTPQQHRAAVKEIFITYLHHDSTFSKAFEAMGSEAATAAIDGMMQRDVQVNNYYLFSATYFNGRRIGFGCLGKVYIKTSPDMQRLLN